MMYRVQPLFSKTPTSAIFLRRIASYLDMTTHSTLILQPQRLRITKRTQVTSQMELQEEFDYDLLMGKSIDPSSWEGSPIQIDSSKPLPNDEELDPSDEYVEASNNSVIIAPSDEYVEASNNSVIIEDNKRKVSNNGKITGRSPTSKRDSSKRIRTNTPHYEEYAEQLRLKASKKNSISDTVNLMKKKRA